MKTDPSVQVKHAAAWILKGLCTNHHWFDEIRHAGHENFEREYHYIPLIDLAQASTRFDIRTLKDACYLLQENNHVDIWGDDYEAYGMLVQVSESGVYAHESFHYGKENRSVLKRAIGVFATLSLIVAIAVGINKSFIHKHVKNPATAFNKAKTF